MQPAFSNLYRYAEWEEWHPLSHWDKLPTASGVYEILNIFRDTAYIGSAVNLKRRGHYNSLKSGKSHNKALQNDFIKDGEQYFKFRIIDFCREEDSVRIEQSRIDERDFSKLYNVAPIAGSTLGYQFSKEQTQALQKNRTGVPWSVEAKHSSWKKRKEREWKAERYKNLLCSHKKTEIYNNQKNQLLDFISENLSKISYTKTDINILSQWLSFSGGVTIIKEKYGIFTDEWSFISKTDGSVKNSIFKSLHGIKKIEDFTDVVLEKIFNIEIKCKIEQEYQNAVDENLIDFDYKPFHFDDLFIENDTEWSRTIQKYDDESIQCFSIGIGKTVKSQQWYLNGNPRLAIIQHIDDLKVEKRVWHENGRPECVINFLNGVLHGVVKKWDKNGIIIYDAIFESGILKEKIESLNSIENSQLDEVLQKPSTNELSGVSVTVGFKY